MAFTAVGACGRADSEFTRFSAALKRACPSSLSVGQEDRPRESRKCEIRSNPVDTDTLNLGAGSIVALLIVGFLFFRFFLNRFTN
jgi:hypothetical protein